MRYIFIFVLLTIVSCEQSTESIGSVNVKVESSQLVIRNNSAAVVYYAVFERDFVAVMDWTPFCTPDNAINYLAKVKIAITDSSYLPSNEAVVFWWHKGKDKYAGTDINRPDEIRSIIVKVR